MNIEVGSEEVLAHGISSWMMAVDDRNNPFGDGILARSRYNISWDWLILVVRDAKDAVPSVILENQHSPSSYAFRRKHIRRQLNIDLDQAGDPVSAAVLSIVCWIEIILKQNPAFSFRIEDEQQKFIDFLAGTKSIAGLAPGRQVSSARVNTGKQYDGIKHDKPLLPDSTWSDLEPAVRERLEWYCERFGYDYP